PEEVAAPVEPQPQKAGQNAPLTPEGQHFEPKPDTPRAEVKDTEPAEYKGDGDTAVGKPEPAKSEGPAPTPKKEETAASPPADTEPKPVAKADRETPTPPKTQEEGTPSPPVKQEPELKEQGASFEYKEGEPGAALEEVAAQPEQYKVGPDEEGVKAREEAIKRQYEASAKEDLKVKEDAPPSPAEELTARTPDKETVPEADREASTTPKAKEEGSPAAAVKQEPELKEHAPSFEYKEPEPKPETKLKEDALEPREYKPNVGEGVKVREEAIKAQSDASAKEDLKVKDDTTKVADSPKAQAAEDKAGSAAPIYGAGAQRISETALSGADFKQVSDNFYLGKDGVVYKRTPDPTNPQNVMLWPQGNAAPPEGFMGPTGRLAGESLDPKALQASGYKSLGDNLYLKDHVVYK